MRITGISVLLLDKAQTEKKEKKKNEKKGLLSAGADGAGPHTPGRPGESKGGLECFKAALPPGLFAGNTKACVCVCVCSGEVKC